MCMNTLAEIEAAVDSLPREGKRELLLYLVTQLRVTGESPPPRDLAREQIEAWIADDELGMTRFHEEW